MLQGTQDWASIEAPARKKVANFGRTGHGMLDESPSQMQCKIQIYRVQSVRWQQRTLAAFRRIDRPGIVALGTQSESDWFVIVECNSLTTELHARRVVLAIDPKAVRTYEYEIRRPEALHR